MLIAFPHEYSVLIQSLRSLFVICSQFSWDFLWCSSSVDLKFPFLYTIAKAANKIYINLITMYPNSPCGITPGNYKKCYQKMTLLQLKENHFTKILTRAPHVYNLRQK